MRKHKPSSRAGTTRNDKEPSPLFPVVPRRALLFRVVPRRSRKSPRVARRVAGPAQSATRVILSSVLTNRLTVRLTNVQTHGLEPVLRVYKKRVDGLPH